MGISEILHKNNPMQKKIDRENRSDFAKLVDRNTELVDKMNDLQEKIDRAIEFIVSRANKAGVQLMPREEELLNILKGSDK